jgi:hypothetical protein
LSRCALSLWPPDMPGLYLIAECYEASALVLVRPEQAIKIDTNKGDKEFLDFPVSHAATVETPSKTYIEIIKNPDLSE